MKILKLPIAWCGMQEANETFSPYILFQTEKMFYPALTHSKNLQNNCDPCNKVSCQVVQIEGKKTSLVREFHSFQ